MKKIASVRTARSCLSADVHVLQLSGCWGIILYPGTNVALCEVGVVLSAEQTS